jgi:hypothetical protein
LPRADPAARSRLASALLPAAALLITPRTRPGLFADPVRLPGSACPGDQFLAFLGRQPRSPAAAEFLLQRLTQIPSRFASSCGVPTATNDDRSPAGRLVGQPPGIGTVATRAQSHPSPADPATPAEMNVSIQ